MSPSLKASLMTLETLTEFFQIRGKFNGDLLLYYKLQLVHFAWHSTFAQVFLRDACVAARSLQRVLLLSQHVPKPACPWKK